MHVGARLTSRGLLIHVPCFPGQQRHARLARFRELRTTPRGRSCYVDTTTNQKSTPNMRQPEVALASARCLRLQKQTSRASKNQFWRFVRLFCMDDP